MKERYDWVTWFRKLALKIDAEGEAYLSDKANQVNWQEKKPNHLVYYGEDNIDPFSFFYYLAKKNTTNQLKPVYTSVNEKFEIAEEPPFIPDNEKFPFYSPTAKAIATFHDGKTFNPALLWKLFRQAVKDEPEINAKDFHDALKIKQVGAIKLTQCLFLINPYCFIPIDHNFKLLIGEHNQILRKSTNIDKKVEANLDRITKSITTEGGWNIYRNEIERIRQTFPGCHLYEIAWFLLFHQSKSIELGGNFFQISTNVYDDGNDHWLDFEENNWVYTGGGGRKRKYPLTEPKQGDIILVNKGQTSKAIGVVEKNDYAESGGFNENSKIHVLWLNKSENQLSGYTASRGCSRAKPHSSTYHAFRNTPDYVPTFEFIERLTENSIAEEDEPNLVSQEQKPKIKEHHPLNQILFGPPGTGKTWNTVNHALAIIEAKSVQDLNEEERKEGRKKIKKRFNELRRAGRIEMVTFHQNYTYEDFIEGIRPVLAEEREDGELGDKRDIKYELSEGIFKRIANCAKENSGQKYVLIIDEINRGNIAKIFGELITLIEQSKRLDADDPTDDPTTVTLPYSNETFGVPKNLYIIGAMNTADRSIALLDTALRRRFDFVETMPNPEHPEIGEDVDRVNCQKLLVAMNQRIRVLLDREHQIGHTYFMNISNMDSLAEKFKNQIIPLLQEYFYDNWEKIDLVLNKNGFIQESSVNEGLFKTSEFDDSERKIYELLPANDDKWQDPGSYINIYQTPKQSAQEGQENQNA